MRGTATVLMAAVCCLLCAASPAAANDLPAWGYNLYGQCNVPAEAESGAIAIAGGSGTAWR